MANESTQTLAVRIKKSLDTIVIITLAALCAGVAKMKMNDQNLAPPSMPEIPAAKFDESILVSGPSGASREEVERLFQVSTRFDRDPRYKSLTSFNIFQVMTVQEREAIENNANREYERADRLFRDGKLAEALQVCDSILSDLPNHRKTILLKATIMAAISAKEAAAKPPEKKTP